MRRIAHGAMGTLLSHLPPRVVRTIRSAPGYMHLFAQADATEEKC